MGPAIPWIAKLSRWSILLWADNLYLAVGNGGEALARGRAYEAALPTIDLGFSHRGRRRQ